MTAARSGRATPEPWLRAFAPFSLAWQPSWCSLVRVFFLMPCLSWGSASCSSMPGVRPWAPPLLALTDSPRALSPVPHRVPPAAPCVAGLCDAVRCIGHRSALHRLSQRAAMASAACCVFVPTVVLGILPCLPPVSLQPYLPASGAAGGLLLCPFDRSEHLSLS